jgi:hypothetical protein
MRQRKSLVDDTDPEVERLMIEGIRRMTPAEKLQKMMALNEMLQALIMARLREQYPDASEEEYRMRLASRFLPADLMKKAFGWDVEEKGY